MRDLAAKIADGLFGGGNHSPKAKHLRLYTEIGDNGRYMAGWSEGPMATRIEHFLVTADLIPRATVAAALRELRARIAAESVSLTPENAAGYSRDIADAENATVELALQHVDATIAKLGLEEPK